MEYVPTILVVDDEPLNREMLCAQLVGLGYKVTNAETGLGALAQILASPPDCVLLDIMMPEMDGRQVLEKLHEDKLLRRLPVIMVTALDDRNSMVTCLELGAEDYLVKPYDRHVLRARIENCLAKKRYRDQEDDLWRHVRDYNLHLEGKLAEQVRQVAEAQLSTIFALSKLVESRDCEMGRHLERVRSYCEIIAQELERRGDFSGQINGAFTRHLCAASPLHDIGKVAIPDAILLKPDKLEPAEFELMKRHCTIGEETLRAVQGSYRDNKFLEIGIEIAASHHERWDGSGYPRGLAEEQIPLSARILAIGDVYDVLTSKRCYKSALSHEESRDLIAAQRTQFDPRVLDAFLACEQRILVANYSLQEA